MRASFCYFDLRYFYFPSLWFHLYIDYLWLLCSRNLLCLNSWLFICDSDSLSRAAAACFATLAFKRTGDCGFFLLSFLEVIRD